MACPDQPFAFGTGRACRPGYDVARCGRWSVVRLPRSPATWSLNTLQRALRRAPDRLPRVSVFTIWRVLREAGLTWQRDRSWCATGRVLRKRKSGTVTVTDPDTEPKKS